jgi:hypothetical protein
MRRFLSTPRRAICALSVLLFVFASGNLQAQLPAKVSITISVTDVSGAVIPEANVSAFAEQKEVASQQTGPNGTASLHLPTGSYELSVTSAGFLPAKRTVTVEKQSKQSFVISLQISNVRGDRMALDDVLVPYSPKQAQTPAKSRLTVSVVDPADAVIPRATVRALAGQEEVAVGQTGQDGKAVLTLAPGSYQIRAEDPGFRSERIQLEITDDSPASHLFRLQPGGGSSAEVLPGPPLELWTPPLDDVWIPRRRIQGMPRFRVVIRVVN